VLGDDRCKRLCGARPIVVLDHVVEVVRFFELLARLAQPILDHAGALRGAIAEPAFQLLDRRCHEHRHSTVDAAFDPVGALRLELEERGLACRPQAVDLASQRPVAVPDEVDVLQEFARLDPPVEFVTVEEPVVGPVLLARSLLAPRRPERERELGETRQDQLDQRALARTGRTGDDEDGTCRGATGG
jgi:hypothetical protein